MWRGWNADSAGVCAGLDQAPNPVGDKYGVPILFGPCFAVSRIRRCAEKVKGFCERGERSDDVQREGREIVSPYPDEGEGRGLVRLRTFLKRSFP